MSPGEWASIEVTGEDLSEDDRILLVTSWEIRGVVALYGSRGKFLCRDRSLMGIQVLGLQRRAVQLCTRAPNSASISPRRKVDQGGTCGRSEPPPALQNIVSLRRIDLEASRDADLSVYRDLGAGTLAGFASWAPTFPDPGVIAPIAARPVRVRPPADSSSEVRDVSSAPGLCRAFFYQLLY